MASCPRRHAWPKPIGPATARLRSYIVLVVADLMTDEHGRPMPPEESGEVEALQGFLAYQRATPAWEGRRPGGGEPRGGVPGPAGGGGGTGGGGAAAGVPGLPARHAGVEVPRAERRAAAGSAAADVDDAGRNAEAPGLRRGLLVHRGGRRRAGPGAVGERGHQGGRRLGLDQ